MKFYHLVKENVYILKLLKYNIIYSHLHLRCQCAINKLQKKKN